MDKPPTSDDTLKALMNIKPGHWIPVDKIEQINKLAYLAYTYGAAKYGVAQESEWMRWLRQYKAEQESNNGY